MSARLSIGLLLFAAATFAQEAEIAALESASWKERYGAAKALGALGDKAKDAVPALLDATDDDHAVVRGAAVKALGSIGDIRAAKRLADLLGSPDKRLSGLASKALVALGPEAFPAVHAAWANEPSAPTARAMAGLGEAARPILPALKAQAEDKGGEGTNGDVFAAYVVLALEPEHAPARKVLARTLRSGSVEEATLVLEHSALLAPKALARGLEHAAAPVRWRTCRALGSRGAEAAPAIPALARELVGKTHVRRAAAGALGRIGEAALPALIEALRNAECAAEVGHACQPMREAASQRLAPLLQDENSAVVARAAWVLADLRSDVALPELRKTLTHADARVRVEAGRAIWLLAADGAAAVEAIVAGLKSADVAVRRRAATTLVSLGAAAKPARAALEEASKDPDARVASTARRALKQLQR